jgi:hypothetical protein
MMSLRVVTVARWTLSVRPSCTPGAGPCGRSVPSWAFLEARSANSFRGLASPCVAALDKAWVLHVAGVTKNQ